MTFHNSGSPVNPHATPAAKSIDSGSGKALTVDVYKGGEVNIALDMPEFQIGVDEDGAPVYGGGHRCGAYDVADVELFRDALTEAIEFSKSIPVDV